MRCAQVAIAMDAQIAPTLVIRQDDQHIGGGWTGLLISMQRALETKAQKNEQQENNTFHGNAPPS